MVADAADGDGDAVHFADETADVGKDIAEVFITHLHAVAFDVEDDVDVVFDERAGHDSCVLREGFTARLTSGRPFRTLRGPHGDSMYKNRKTFRFI